VCAGAGALTLTLVVAAFLVASVWSRSGWGLPWASRRLGLIVASGLLSAVLGILIYAQFPRIGLVVAGMAAIQLLFDGWGLVIGPCRPQREEA
jgi:uncharacterized membrane protein HdeD (DUF308 family)